MVQDNSDIESIYCKILVINTSTLLKGTSSYVQYFGASVKIVMLDSKLAKTCMEVLKGGKSPTYQNLM